MTKAKPFLARFASELRNDTKVKPPDTRSSKNDITPPSTFLTKVRNETTDDN